MKVIQSAKIESQWRSGKAQIQLRREASQNRVEIVEIDFGRRPAFLQRSAAERPQYKNRERIIRSGVRTPPLCMRLNIEHSACVFVARHISERLR